MIRIRLGRTEDGVLKRFSVSGHANYAEAGEDIVCAAVSALTIATANGLMNEHVALEYLCAEGDEISLALAESLSEEETISARAILETFALGVESIAKEYGTSYVTIETSTL